MSEIRRPPVLRIGHQGAKVLLHSLQIEALELLSVVETLAHGIRQRGLLVQDIQTQLVGPPVPVCGTASGGMMEWAPGFSLFVTHRWLLSLCPRGGVAARACWAD